MPVAALAAKLDNCRLVGTATRWGHARGAAGWLWTLLGGALSVVLGVMIINEWPQSGLWVIGLFVAIEILFAGWSQIMIALAAKNYTAKDAATAS